MSGGNSYTKQYIPMPTELNDRHDGQPYLNNLIVRRQKAKLFVILQNKSKENRGGFLLTVMKRIPRNPSTKYKIQYFHLRNIPVFRTK
jgi:hypothetical protein